MPHNRARTVEDAAWVHLNVFTLPIGHWPIEFAARLPDFDQLYQAPPAITGPDPVTKLKDALKRTPGPVKMLLTGQKGAGKSWALKRIAQDLAPDFAVISASATDSTGVTMPDAEVDELLVLIAEQAAVRIEGAGSLGDASPALARWIQRLVEKGAMPAAPSTTEGLTAEVRGWLGKLTARMRSDAQVRAALRETPTDDLLIVTQRLLRLVRDSRREPIVLMDDVDKINTQSARRIFLEQFSTLSLLDTRMVVTYPFSLNFDGVGVAVFGQMKTTVLRNVKVVSKKQPLLPRPEAIAHFRHLLERIVDPALIEEDALAEAVRLSGGVTREFGHLLQRGMIAAFYAHAPTLTLGLLRDGVSEYRIELERATSDADVRASLLRIRRTKRLDDDLDRRLLDRNLAVEYVNGDLWHDVHPVLAEAVDEWSR